MVMQWSLLILLIIEKDDISHFRKGSFVFFMFNMPMCIVILNNYCSIYGRVIRLHCLSILIITTLMLFTFESIPLLPLNGVNYRFMA